MIRDTVALKHGKWVGEICPRLGGNAVSLKYDGEDVLRPLESEEQLEINPYLQGMPILLPANRTYMGRFTFEGKEYSLKVNEPANNASLHGFVHLQSFELTEYGADRATVRYTNRSAEVYPFDFTLSVYYSVDEQGFSARYEIVNDGDGNMPLTFCLHTTFVEPESFCVPIDMCQEKDSHHIPTGRYVELNDGEKEIVTGSRSKGKVISGYYRSCGNIAHVGDYTYSVSDNFDHWIFFNGRGESGLLCVEPQAGAVNGLNIEGGHIVLPPHERIEFTTRISKNCGGI